MFDNKKYKNKLIKFTEKMNIDYKFYEDEGDCIWIVMYAKNQDFDKLNYYRKINLRLSEERAVELWGFTVDEYGYNDNLSKKDKIKVSARSFNCAISEIEESIKFGYQIDYFWDDGAAGSLINYYEKPTIYDFIKEANVSLIYAVKDKKIEKIVYSNFDGSISGTLTDSDLINQTRFL